MDLSTRILVYRYAALRKLRRKLGLQTDPYPLRPEGTRLSPSLGLLAEVDGSSRYMAINLSDVTGWQVAARKRLAQITGYQSTSTDPYVVATRGPASIPGAPGVERTTYYLRVRAETDVPVTILSQTGDTYPLPVFMHLAGSTSGVHLGWGEARIPIDHQRLSIGADMALQAVNRGYLAVCIEQIGFGERLERDLPKPSSDRTIDTAIHAALLGKTLMGLKAMDVSAVIDWLVAAAPSPIDVDRLYLFGHSSGGTAAIFATALDERIAGVLASGCVRRLSEIVSTRGNSNGEYLLPGFLDAFEIDDVVALAAPRPFVALSGQNDHIFPHNGVVRVVEGAKSAYAALNAADRLRAIRAPAGHQYYAEESWAAWQETIDPVMDTD